MNSFAETHGFFNTGENARHSGFVFISDPVDGMNDLLIRQDVRDLPVQFLHMAVDDSH